jgi:hypothetical protein
MKNKIILIMMTMNSFMSFGQEKKQIIQLDTMPLDLSKVELYKDTLFFDINADKKTDIFLKYTYKYKVPVPMGESGQIILIYINSDSGKYNFKTSNNAILWLVHNEIKQIDNKSFVVINEGSGKDWNRYYCYFLYDKKVKDWFLEKYEIYKFDDKDRVLVEKKEYDSISKIVFKSVSFDKLFGKKRAELQEPAYYEKIKSEKAYLHSLPSEQERKSIYMIKGDEVKIVDEQGEFYKIYFYGNSKKSVSGWIRKKDVD